MPGQPPSQRSKPEIPQIPGVSPQSVRAQQPGLKPVRLLGLLAGLVACLFLVRWVMRSNAPEAAPARPTPQIELPEPAADPNAALPHATETEPGIATVQEMTQPWASKEFLYKNRLSGETVPAVLVRLPTGSPYQPANYWAFSVQTPYGNCRLEYIADIEK